MHPATDRAIIRALGDFSAEKSLKIIDLNFGWRIGERPSALARFRTTPPRASPLIICERFEGPKRA
jgi:hypothetical protein